MCICILVSFFVVVLYLQIQYVEISLDCPGIRRHIYLHLHVSKAGGKNHKSFIFTNCHEGLVIMYLLIIKQIEMLT